jgi:SAM-dependent methyltransferase
MEEVGFIQMKTHSLFSLVALSPPARVLDVGCGEGRTMRVLGKMAGVEAWGVDPVLPSGAEAYEGRLRRGRAEALPFDAASFDALVFECSLSVTDDPAAALSEAARVLKPDGVLYVADIYAKSECVEFASPFGRFERKETLRARFVAAGFHFICFEDTSAGLRSFWARLVFEGADDCSFPSGFKGGYFLSVLEQDAFTPGSLASYQEKGRGEALARARSQGAFWREYQSGAFTGATDLTAQGERMLCAPLGEVARVRTAETSGSSGPAKRVWFTGADLERTVTFFARGMRPLVRMGETCVIMMSDERPDSVADLLRRGLERIGAGAVIHGSVRGLESAEAVRQGACLVGLPAEIFWLCRSAPELRPRTVLLSADYVPGPLIAAIEAAWRCRVFTHYGMTETCYGFAVQCSEREAMHIRLDDFIVEIIDPETGKILPDGVEGEVTLTSLASEALPLVRYRTGDSASLVTTPCACGSLLPRLGPVRGRLEHLRQPLNIHRLDDTLYALPGLRGYRAGRDQDGALSLLIEGGPVDEIALSRALGVPLSVRYGSILPFTGKRTILEALP